MKKLPRFAKTKVPFTVRLCKTLLESMYLDGDKKMWVCKTFRGTPLLIPVSTPSNEIHQLVRTINHAEGISTPAPKTIKTTPKQLGLPFVQA